MPNRKSSDNYKISIALCTYNGAQYLREQLTSFIGQTRLPDELLVCDDASTDATVKLIQDFSTSAPFPVICHSNKANLGSTKNFERAISLCTGDIIFLSDQDDVWLPHKIERIESEFLRSQDVGLVFSDPDLVDDELRPLNDRLWNYTFPPNRRADADSAAFYKTLLQGNVVTGATAAFRSQFVRDFIPMPESLTNLVHDAWIALFISVSAEIAFINEPLIRYRQHASQQIGVNWNIERDGVLRECFNAALEFTKSQRGVLEEISTRPDHFPSLMKGGKIANALPASISAVEGRIVHLENRLKINRGRAGRIPLIVQELLTGRYRRYSRGWLSAAKDLISS